MSLKIFISPKYMLQFMTAQTWTYTIFQQFRKKNGGKQLPAL